MGKEEEKGKGGRKRRKETAMCKKYTDWLPLIHPQLGNLAHNPGMCCDWESNLQPFCLQTSTQSTELHQPGQK